MDRTRQRHSPIVSFHPPPHGDRAITSGANTLGTRVRNQNRPRCPSADLTRLCHCVVAILTRLVARCRWPAPSLRASFLITEAATAGVSLMNDEADADTCASTHCDTTVQPYFEELLAALERLVTEISAEATNPANRSLRGQIRGELQALRDDLSLTPANISPKRSKVNVARRLQRSFSHDDGVAS